MRRRAISSRIISAPCPLCSAESCLSGVDMVTPARPPDPSRHTFQHKTAQTRPPPRRTVTAFGQTLPIILLARKRQVGAHGRHGNTPSGATKMTTLDDIETPQPEPVFELRSFVRSSLVGIVKLTVM